MENSRKSVCELSDRVAGKLATLVPDGASILVGLSGGVDSVVLLHVLAQLAPRFSWKLSALHVHHGISPHADEWAAFCEKLCTRHDLPLHLEHVDIEPLRHLGVEAAARELRHSALAGQQVDFIALAHHQDDQAETLLLQLLRGSGAKGAAAMPMLQAGRGGPALVRPLLDIARETLIAYAQQHELQWVEDESNEDSSYPRNFLRHRVLPVLQQRFPTYRETLARSARHFAEAAELMETLAELDADGFAFPSARSGRADEPLLAISSLQTLGLVRSKNLLRYLLHCRGVSMPDHRRMEEMLRQLLTSRADGQVCVSWSNWEVRSFRNRVYVCPSLPNPDTGLNIPWRGEKAVELPQLGGVLRFDDSLGEGISLARLNIASASIRLRSGEERLRPDATRPERSLQYLFQEHDVPPWQRVRWPLLYCGETLVAIPGISTAVEFRAKSGETGTLPNWIQSRRLG